MNVISKFKINDQIIFNHLTIQKVLTYQKNFIEDIFLELVPLSIPGIFLTK